MNGLLSLAQTAQLLTVDLDIVRALIAQGLLPWIVVGHDFYIPKAAAIELLIDILFLAIIYKVKA